MYNIFYLEDQRQVKDSLHLNQIHLPLETICQIDKFGDYEFNIVNNGQVDQLNENPVIIPFDYQSIPFSYESRDKIDQVTNLGKVIQKLVRDVVDIVPNKKIFLFYTSTEPYFNDNCLFISDLASVYPDCEFVLSGSGHVESYYQNNIDTLNANNNVRVIPKLWYIDRVHYIKTYSEFVGTSRHFDETSTVPPPDTPDYMICPNKFLLTMRNPRPHRVIMSTFIERNLSYVRYSRNWSLQPWWLDKIKTDFEEEYQYQVNLILKAVKGMLDTCHEPKFVKEAMDTIYHPPHILDMKTIEDRGHPPKWLYDNICIALIPTGEHNGYGYADEKQIIPMYYKKPFITFGQVGVYEELEKLGFDVFRDVFNLEFSKEKDLYKHVQQCYYMIRDIAKLESADLVQLIDKCDKAVKHNYVHITSGEFRHVSNNNFFGELINASS